jgi:flagellar export protein FliJ
MKKFSFKLEAILKVRQIKEDQCKMQMGRIQVEINHLKNQIEVINQGVAKAYDSQEGFLNSGTSGQQIRFYPYFVEGNRNQIKHLQYEISVLEQELSEKQTELARLRGDVKIIENMKEKEFQKFKKEYNKQQELKIEEQILMWNASDKSTG